jgi:c(7)-type cytochrome triheme protein
MKKTSWAVVLGIAVLCGMQTRKALAQDQKPDAAKPEAAKPAGDAPKPPESVVLDKTAKMAPVTFAHADHAKKFECKECHGGDKPLFPQKKAEAGMKMADMYAGKQCGACHDGKKTVDGKPDGKAIFAAKAGCMKCHKKPAP